jgi:hypothetical protein
MHCAAGAITDSRGHIMTISSVWEIALLCAKLGRRVDSRFVIATIGAMFMLSPLAETDGLAAKKSPDQYLQTICLTPPSYDADLEIFVDKIGGQFSSTCRRYASCCRIQTPPGKHSFIVLSNGEVIMEKTLFIANDPPARRESVYNLSGSTFSHTTVKSSLLVEMETTNPNANGASVYVGQELRGAIPAKIELDPGKHVITFIQEGFKPSFLQVEVASSPYGKIVYPRAHGNNLDLLMPLAAEAKISIQFRDRVDLCREVAQGNDNAWYANVSVKDEGIDDRKLTELINQIMPGRLMNLECDHCNYGQLYLSMPLYDFQKMLDFERDGRILATATLTRRQAEDLSVRLKEIGTFSIPWWFSPMAIAAQWALPQGAMVSVVRGVWAVINFMSSSYTRHSAANEFVEILAEGGQLKSILNAAIEPSGKRYVWNTTVYQVQIGQEMRQYVIGSNRYAIKLTAKSPNGKDTCAFRK